MPKFAANLSLLFSELPYLDRFDAAAEAGFEAVEILFPYDVPAKDTKRALLRNGLDLVLINAPPPNYTGGDPGFGAVPGGEARFQNDVRRVLRYCEQLKPQFVHVMAGYTKDVRARETFVSNLQWAADQARQQMFTIEPLNSKDQPGYFLDDYVLASEILDDVNRPNVGLQYDSYHAQLIHGDAAAIWETYAPRVVHAQIGATPNRSEPADGEIDFASLFKAMDDSGYDGWVSAEYNPSTKRTTDSLHWMF